MNQLSLVDVQWSRLSLFVSLFLDCVKFRRKKWKRGFTIETPVHVRCCRAWQGRSQPAYTVLTKNAMLCPCVCFKPVTLFGVASILCQNFREGHTGISPYIMYIDIYIYIYYITITSNRPSPRSESYPLNLLVHTVGLSLSSRMSNLRQGF